MRPVYNRDDTAYKLFVFILTFIYYIYIDIGNSDSDFNHIQRMLTENSTHRNHFRKGVG